MKNYFTLSFKLALLFTPILFVSCSHDLVEGITQEEWVNTNITKLENMSRIELSEYSPDLIDVIQSKLSNQKRIDLWNEKLNQVVSAKKWTEKELDFFKETRAFLNKGLFDDENLDEAYNRYEKWMNYAINELDWTEEEIHMIFMTLKDVQFERNEMALTSTTSRQAPIHQPVIGKCTCNFGASCWVQGKRCVDGDCRAYGTRCDFFDSRIVCTGFCQ